jgi:hypothetical protein
MTVEVDGVCSITKDSVKCWQPTGSPNAQLAFTVEAGLMNSSAFANGSLQSPQLPVNNRHQRARLVVFKVIDPTNGRAGANTQVIGLDEGDWRPRFHAPGPIPTFSIGQGYGPQEQHSRYDARWLTTVNSSDSTTSADVAITEPCTECPEIPLEKGAAAQIQGAGLKIESIAPATAQGWQGRPMRSNRKMWEIDVRFSEPTSRVSLWPVLPLDPNGVPIYVDMQGKPVTADEVYRKTMELKANMRPRPGESAWVEPPYQPARITGGWGNTSMRSFQMNIDPKYVTHIYVQAQRTKIVRFTGIRLDPNRSIIP